MRGIATNYPADVQEALATGDVALIRHHIIERLLGDPFGSARDLPAVVDALEREIPGLFEDDELAASVPMAMDARLYYEALVAELRLHFSRVTWSQVLKASRALPRPADQEGVSRWVSIAFVIGLTVLGALLLFGPPVIRYLFSNWA
ncbi:hypothetical protein [Sulfobacillus harzensis]|uniref:Uncharacterized protein n=1 Tax=Sulfobacillus harzensis TaxID=2729629 RepID=A0A7Y0Q540_9FIRM|nr:hypothetical protein [Sulfobacillus harzensis]NMP23869.1 hypothetical protein [Sulfobacillus harzensis]